MSDSNKSTPESAAAADREFAQRVGQRLRDSEQSLSVERQQQLRSARAAAVAAATSHRSWRHRPSVWVPAAAFATTVLALGLLLRSPVAPLPDLPAAEAVVVEELELLEELEFYAWMLEQDDVGSG